MRIISGEARGLKLLVPGQGTRPATDRTREALFAILGQHVDGAHVLDLFAGSGAYGLEALSRGAADAHFVESAPDAQSVLRKNFSRSPFEKRCFLTAKTVKEALARFTDTNRRFDLVFADPPYTSSSSTQQLLETLPPNLLVRTLNPNALVVIETASSSQNLLVGVEGLEILTSRRYGNSRIEVYQHTTSAPPSSPS